MENNKTLLQQLYYQFEANQNNIAVRFGSQQLSYGELNHNSNQLAYYLRQQGIAVGSVVGIQLHRSINLVVAMIAVLKSGAAYLPIDPSLPDKRIVSMCDDAKPHIVINDDTDIGSILEKNDCIENLPIYSDMKDLTYVLFTSGSTGRPKGVMIDYAAITNRLEWMQQQLQLQEDDVVLQKTPIGFDVSIWEFLWPLLNGATLVVAEPHAHKDPQALKNIIEKNNITTLHFVPPMLQVFLQSIDKRSCQSIKRIICSGESLLPTTVSLAQQTLPQAVIYNLYGPTEAAIDVSYWQCSGNEAPIPIGRPISNIKFHVLDEQMNKVKQGDEGELYIEGVGLARGYINREDLTKEKFISHPSATLYDERLYKTGDLVKCLGDDVYVYMGRIDDQVKIRGNRIELGEIESILLEHDKIDQCAVVVMSVNSQKSLVAYCVSSLSDKSIEEYLQQHVPDYMLPVTYISMECLPLTVNGKIDRKKLNSHDLQFNNVAATEKKDTVIDKLITIWQKALGTENKISTTLPFLLQGGNSLVAALIVSEIEQEFSRKMLISELFELDTIVSVEQFLKKAQAHQKSVDIVHEERAAVVPCTAQQSAIFRISRLSELGSIAYNLPMIFNIKGDLDLGALQCALNKICAEESQLQSVFFEENGICYQRALPYKKMTINVEKIHQNSLEECLNKLANDKFDLQQSSPLKVKLYSTVPGNHTLAIVMHHIISDGWSQKRFMQRLNEYYCKKNMLLSSINYYDYSDYQHATSEDASDVDFWQQQLEGCEGLSLPLDKMRPPQFSYSGDHYFFALDEGLTKKLKQYCKQKNLTPFIVLLSAFSVVMHHYTRQEDFIIGTAYSNRQHRWSQDILGLMVNILPLPIHYSEKSSIDEFTEYLKRIVFQLMEHQQTPLEHILKAGRYQHDPSVMTLCPVLFVFQPDNISLDNVTLGDLKLEQQHNLPKASKFDLTFTVEEKGSAMGGNIEYCTDLFDAETIENLFKCFKAALDSLVSVEMKTISDVVLMPADEKKQLINSVNKTVHVKYEQENIVERFASISKQYPNCIALKFQNTEVSYSELYQRSERIANQIRAQYYKLYQCEMPSDTLIALTMLRSETLIIAIIAILMSGAAYVPVDPSYPEERKRFILSDSKAALLISDEKVEDYPENKTFNLAELDIICSSTVEVAIKPDDLAYIIYTSGSTGKPKGVMVEHYNVVRLFDCARRDFIFSKNDIWSLFHSYAFDFSVWEIWGALLFGGKIVVVPFDVSRDPLQFRQLVSQEKITVLSQTPASFMQFIEADAQIEGCCDSLRYVVFGGERLELSMLKSWWEKYRESQPKLINMYGTTETTVHATFRCLKQSDCNKSVNSPVGNALQDLQLLVLDRDQNLLPDGVPGELYIAGSGVTRGYLFREELTRSRFVKLSGMQPLFYRTGDCVRKTLSGDMVYLGRLDRQIKLHGFRIELAEIESTIMQHPNVSQVVVSLLQNPSQLACYYTEVSEVSAQSIRKHAEENLPSYMVPNFFIKVPSIPKTAHGKINFEALPDARNMEKEIVILEDNPLQKILLKTWTEVLKVKNINAADNFYRLGGDSILSIRMITMLRSYNIYITPTDLIKNPTIQALSEVVNVDHANKEIWKITSEKFSLSPIQEWFFKHNENNPHHWNQAVMFELDEAINRTLLANAITAVINYHAEFSLHFCKLGEEYKQFYSSN
ncbi:MAG: amino acid adenylation domain-containing protein [Gammaproteobacteria bacterium]|nr:amino acid adenylation domain-containing protein [Gammaproteobacteria bacterium]